MSNSNRTDWLLGLLSGLTLLAVVGAFRTEGRLSTMEEAISNLRKQVDRIEDKLK